MAKKFRYKHISSIIEDRVPSELLDGEIAVNRFAGKEKLFIKNSSGQIISFIPEHTVLDLLSQVETDITTLSANLKTLSIAVIGDINRLNTGLNEEIERATAADDSISGEVTTLSGAIESIQEEIDNEVERAMSAETILQEEIDTVSAHTTTLAIACAEDFQELSGSLKTLTIAIGEDFDEFEYNINQLSSSTKQIESSVSGIVGDNIRELSASVITLSSSTEGIASDLYDEITRATNVDNTLSGSVNTLSGNVTTLSGNVITLSGNLDTLAIAATEDIDELQYQVDIKTALLDEKVDNEITRARTSEQSVSGAVQTLSAGTLNTFTRKPVTIWETDGTTGLLGVNNSTMDLSNSWQLEDLDFTPYKFVLAYFKQADTGATATAATPSVVCTIPLDSASLSTGYTAYVGGAGGTNPNNRDIHFQVLCAIDSTKTKFQVVSEHSIAGTILAQKNDNGRYCYKIVGYYE